jgi:hypothetical protein
VLRKGAIHLIANAAILALGYYWLGIPESRASTLTWSIFIALTALILTTLTYTASFLNQSRWRTAVKNLLPMLVAVLGVTLLYWMLAQYASYAPKPAFKIASWLTLKFRHPVPPTTILRIIQIKLWIIRWIVLPVFLVPVLSAIASRGRRGFRTIRWRYADWRYWIEAPLLLLCCARVPLLLLNWVPRLEGFALQSTSFLLRALLAYLLFGAAWLVLAFVTSEGSPRKTQPSTAGSP